ncbi:MAG: Mut7-C RNAse domain-containing protein [Chitinophagaceae bacterium]|nr:Mut7-C RNAse domain-containing protein [Chitinophagaceae bacterium]
MLYKFIADVHLGRLARLLRMFGFDTAYKNTFTNSELASIAIEEERILLSRNAAFSKILQIKFIRIYHEEPQQQLKQVIDHFQLKNFFQPFTRCVVCNGTLIAVAKEKVLDKININAIRYFDEFWQCNTCDRIYWKGSHYDRMMDVIEELIKV